MGAAAEFSQPLDDSRYIGVLRSVPMDHETLGQRLLAAVIPAHFKDLNALHLASRIAYSTVHKWKTGEANPRWEQVETVAGLVGINAFRLLNGSDGRVRVGDHPEWAPARAGAEKRYHGRVPPHFYDIAEETSGAALPEHLDESFAFSLAQFWYQHATDDQIARADTAAAKRELDAARASRNRPRE